MGASEELYTIRTMLGVEKVTGGLLQEWVTRGKKWQVDLGATWILNLNNSSLQIADSEFKRFLRDWKIGQILEEDL